VGWFHFTSACGRTNKELVFNQCCLNFPLIPVTRWPRCATFYIEISSFVFITLSCQILFAMNKFIWYFGLVLHNSISCVKHVDFYFTFYDTNETKLWTKMQPKLYIFIHQNTFLLLKCIEIELGKINYYLSNSNLESKKYLVNSEFVEVNFKLKQDIIKRYKESDGSVLIILIRSIISSILFVFK
jgi:hypothetical protein